METENHEKEEITQQTSLSLKKQMIIRVCRFLSEEYNFIRLHNVDNCKLAPLAGITSRAAQATGVTPSYISRIYAPYKERDAALSSNSGLSTKHVRQKGRVTKEASDTIPVLKYIKTDPNSDSDEDTVTKKPLLYNAYAIKQESADNEKEIPRFESEKPDFNQQILHITQEPSDNEQERPSIAQEIKQEIQDINQESSDNKQETSSIKQETLYIKQETTVHELGEGNTEIDFEKEIPAKMMMIEELKMEKLSSSADNLRYVKVKSKKTNFMQLNRLYVPSKNNKKNAIVLDSANKTKLMEHGESSSPSMEQAEYRFPPVTKQYAAKTGKGQRIRSIKQQNLQLEDTENTHRIEIDTVTDLNQKRRLSSYTFIEQGHEIPPGCPKVRQTLLSEDKVQGKNNEPNLDQILQVDNNAEQQKKGENDLPPSNKFEANVVGVAKFENKQESKAVSRFCDAKIEKVDTMIARVYLFIKDEYQFMKTYNVDNCNLSPLHSCTERAAKATGVYLNDVKNAIARTKALHQKKQLRTYEPSKKRKPDDRNIITDNKAIKLNINNIDYKDSHTDVAGSHTSNSAIRDICDKVNVDNSTHINQEAGYKFTEREHEMPPVCSKNNKKNAIVLDSANKTKLMEHGESSSPSMEQAEYRFPPVTKQYAAKTGKGQRIRSIKQQNLQLEDTENTHRIEIDTVTDLNQKRRLSSYTFIEQGHEIPPGCPKVRQTLLSEDKVQGKNNEPNLDQILQVDNNAEQQKKGENDLPPSNKFEANVVGVAKFENKQESKAVSRFCDAKIEKVDTMIARVYLFIKDEYQFMKTYNVDNCNLSPLHSCTERAAKATGVYLNDVKNAIARTKALHQKKQLRTYEPSKKRKPDDRNIITDNKAIKLNINNIDYKDSHTDVAGSHTSNSAIIDICDKVNVDNSTHINQEAGYKFTEREHEMPPVCRNLHECLQFEDEIKKENTEIFNTNNSKYNTQEIDLPSTCIKQEDYEMLPLSNRYTENDEDEYYILQFEDEDTVNSDQGNSDIETFIIQEVEFPSPSIKQEENEMTSLNKTYTIHEKNLNQVLQVDAEHLTSTKKVENDSLPSDKFEAKIGVVKFEDAQEFEAVSYMEKDCYKLEPKLEKVDVSETSVSEQFICYENLPSSSGNNNNIIPKANETEDIEFVFIKNEFHSDSSHE